MKYKQLSAVALIVVMLWYSVASAASISTRVRVLETKVAKQDRVIKQQSVSQNKSLNEMTEGLKQVEDLKKQVELLVRQQSKQLKSAQTPDRPLVDKRYAYP